MTDLSEAAVVHSWLALLPNDLYSSRLLRSLEYPDLRALFCTSRASRHALLTEGPEFWISLTEATLGSALTRVHLAAARLLRRRLVGAGEDAPSTKVCRELLRRAHKDLAARKRSKKPPALRWDPDASKKLYSSSESRELLRVCGHTATEVGRHIVILGGSRLSPHRPSGVTLIDTQTLTCRAAKLSADSIKPMPRLRHTLTAISPSDEGYPRALVLGGVSEVFHHLEEMHSAVEGLILEILDEEWDRHAGVVRWRHQSLSGPAPGDGAPLFHHVAGGFDSNRQVVVWGGDTQDFSDGAGQAAAAAECSERKAFAFVLDVKTWSWKKIRTHGPTPSHRSVAESVVHHEKLVIYGGSEDPKPPRAFVFGTLPSMKPMVLNLKNFTWEDVRPQPDFMPMPMPRTRFPSELRGNFALVVGGRGQFGETLDDVWRLDLRTLQWQEQRVKGKPLMARNASVAAALCGGLLLGGMTNGHPCMQAQALLADVLEADPDNIDEDQDEESEEEEEEGETRQEGKAEEREEAGRAAAEEAEEKEEEEEEHNKVRQEQTACGKSSSSRSRSGGGGEDGEEQEEDKEKRMRANCKRGGGEEKEEGRQEEENSEDRQEEETEEDREQSRRGGKDREDKVDEMEEEGSTRAASSNATPTTNDCLSQREASREPERRTYPVELHLPWLHALGEFLNARVGDDDGDGSPS